MKPSFMRCFVGKGESQGTCLSVFPSVVSFSRFLIIMECSDTRCGSRSKCFLCQVKLWRVWDIGQRLAPQCDNLRLEEGETLKVSIDTETSTREVHVVKVPVERPVARVVPQPIIVAPQPVRVNARIPPAFANAGVAPPPRAFARPRRQRWSSSDDEPDGPPLRPPRIDVEALLAQVALQDDD